MKLSHIPQRICKLDKKKIKGLLQSLGLVDDDVDDDVEVLFFSDSQGIFPGGLLVIQSGMKEVEEQIE